MPSAERTLSLQGREFYRAAMDVLAATGRPFLVGGAYAFQEYAGIERHTRDFDVFVLPEDIEPILARFRAEGYRAELTFAHWLGKVHQGDHYVDLIFSSGNGVARVDDLWFEHATRATVLDTPVRLIPVEEMMWSKGFIMERERFDGADIVHLIHARADRIDWDRLLWRFGRHARVLLAHLVMFGFVYPNERDKIPRRVMETLIERLDDPIVPEGSMLCPGTMLSRSQYHADLERGYGDVRLEPQGRMTAEEIAVWTAAAEEHCPPSHVVRAAGRTPRNAGRTPRIVLPPRANGVTTSAAKRSPRS